jgi:flagellar M-ring protein FliF
VPALPAANALVLPDGVALSADGQTVIPASGPNMIDVATIQGQVHAQSVHRVGELADRNPNETAAIVRAWLQEPA